MKHYKERIHHYRFEILFFSFMILMFYSLFLPKLSFSIALLLNVIAGLNMFPQKKKKLVVPLTIAGALLITAFLGAFIPGAWLKSMGFAIFVIFFLFVAYEVFHQIYKSPKVNVGIIYGLFCGLIILGILGALIFTIIEQTSPGSFSNLSQGPGKVNDLVYFSFITLLTIGFGDIIPLSSIAQRLTMLFGIVGHFYTVVVIALVIGKYLANSMVEKKS